VTRSYSNLFGPGTEGKVLNHTGPMTILSRNRYRYRYRYRKLPALGAISKHLANNDLCDELDSNSDPDPDLDFDFDLDLDLEGLTVPVGGW